MSQEPNDKKPLTLDDMVARGAALRHGPDWKPSTGLIEAVADIERADELPAPDPVVLLPEKGGQVVVTETDAAEAYVGPTVVRTGLSPRMPTGPVKIRADVDPRRQPTLRRVPMPAGAVRAASGSAAMADAESGDAERGAEAGGTKNATPSEVAPRAVATAPVDAASTASAGASAIVREPARDAPGGDAEQAECAGTIGVDRPAGRSDAEPVAPRGDEPAATGGSGSTEAGGVPSASVPSANVPSVRPANKGRGARRLLVRGVATIVAAGVVTVLVLRALSPAHHGAGAGDGAAGPVRATAEHAGASAERPPSAATLSASCVTACPSGEVNVAAASATNAAPSASTVAAPIASAATAALIASTGGRAAPAPTEDPYVDASAPAASMKPTAAAPASAAPVVTAQASGAAATAAPPSTTSPRPGTSPKPAGGTKLDD